MVLSSSLRKLAKENIYHEYSCQKKHTNYAQPTTATSRAARNKPFNPPTTLPNNSHANTNLPRQTPSKTRSHQAIPAVQSHNLPSNRAFSNLTHNLPANEPPRLTTRFDAQKLNYAFICPLSFRTCSETHNNAFNNCLRHFPQTSTRLMLRHTNT